MKKNFKREKERSKKREKVCNCFYMNIFTFQVYRSVRMPQLHTSLHFHLTPIVMLNGSSRRDLHSNSHNFYVAPSPQGQRTRRGLDCAIGGSGEVGIRRESTHLGVGLLLRCFQQLSAPHLATQRLPWAR